MLIEFEQRFDVSNLDLDILGKPIVCLYEISTMFSVKLLKNRFDRLL